MSEHSPEREWYAFPYSPSMNPLVESIPDGVTRILLGEDVDTDTIVVEGGFIENDQPDHGGVLVPVQMSDTITTLELTDCNAEIDAMVAQSVDDLLRSASPVEELSAHDDQAPDTSEGDLDDER